MEWGIRILGDFICMKEHINTGAYIFETQRLAYITAFPAIRDIPCV